jgi:hypothetical protein
MKTVVYTNGDGHDHVIYAVLQVPDGMTMQLQQALYHTFIKDWYPDKKHLSIGSPAAEQKANTDYIADRTRILQAAGYEGCGEDELFISWLCKNHGCVKVDYEEWY